RSFIFAMKRTSALYLLGILWFVLFQLFFTWNECNFKSAKYFLINTPKIGARFNLTYFTLTNGAVFRK
ncbi:hypothetical protein PFISCL1PPCAC_269, partial [Pristionchus fissidentatus]